MANLEEVFKQEWDRENPAEWNKIHLYKGVEFLGTFVKPYREYVSNRTLERMQKKLQQVNLRNREAALRSVNSYLGIMSHTASYNLRRSMFGDGEFAELIEYDADMRKGWLKVA